MRKVLGVVIGYIVMIVFVFITFGITYMALGTEGSFQPNSYGVSIAWIAASLILGFIGAAIGGWVSMAIGRSRKASMVLAGLVFVLGILMAIPTLSDVDPKTLIRSGDVAMMDAMQNARQPSWLAFLNPLIGAVGVIIGARFRKEPDPIQ